jgi:hypothetical protein
MCTFIQVAMVHTMQCQLRIDYWRSGGGTKPGSTFYPQATDLPVWLETDWSV